MEVTSTTVDFTVSPGFGKQKKLDISLTQRSWFDALEICKQRGFDSHLTSSKGLDTFKTVRKATITERGTSNIDVWTAFIHFNYTWMAESEWRNSRSCSLMEGYTITSAEPRPQQCSHAHLADTGVLVALHESSCSDLKYFVCYKVANTPLEMAVYSDTLYNYNVTTLRAVQESPISMDDCMTLCVTRRYCVVAVFHDDDGCVTIWYYIERELVLTASTGVNGYTTGVKHGGIVTFASTVITPAENTTELPCSPVNTNIDVPSTTISVEQAVTTKSTTGQTTSTTGQTTSTTGQTTSTTGQTASTTGQTASTTGQTTSTTGQTASTTGQTASTTGQTTSTTGQTASTTGQTASTTGRTTSTTGQTASTTGQTASTTGQTTSTTGQTASTTGQTASTTGQTASTTGQTTSTTGQTATVQTVPESTAFNNMNVTCRCACISNVFNNYSFDDLKINKKLLSSYTRRKISAYDDRLSSKVLGVSGAIIIVTLISVIVALDLLNVVKAMKNIPNARMQNTFNA